MSRSGASDRGDVGDVDVASLLPPPRRPESPTAAAPAPLPAPTAAAPAPPPALTSVAAAAGGAVASSPAGPPAVSVIVPTRNEALNVDPLLRRLDAALAGLTCEVIFVDDSDDETPAAIEVARRSCGIPVRVLHRAPQERHGGLGGAVCEGIRMCAAAYVVVMDGDLQHPPETVPELLATAREQSADVVVGSRYVDGGSANGLAGKGRRLISSGSNRVSRLVFPRRLRGVSDVMSGFFLLRVQAFDVDALRPDGYKILLELLVSARKLRVREIAYEFGERQAGASNASLTQGVRFLRRLFALRVPRPARFALIGISGLLPNLATTWLLHHAAGLNYLVAATVGTQVAIVWNFVGCELLVWHGPERVPLRRFLPFLLINNADLVLRLPLLTLLVDGWGLGVGLSTLITLAVAVVARYFVVDRTIYRTRSFDADPRVESPPAQASVPVARTAATRSLLPASVSAPVCAPTGGVVDLRPQIENPGVE
ncbi:glycosyltransferase family 2 protein [Frankia sp. R43]|uniref:glycosyltransferase n=1 Tax=Frankia sp. R43 TaxID=269536 RepID=UPI0006CA08A0|nr:glycosyltransferase family 2 protein [Frankia sp. R43]